MAIAQDASTPSFSSTVGGTNLGSSYTSGTVTQTSASFSPPAGSLVVMLVVVTYDGQSNSYSSTGLTAADSLSNTYSAPISVPANASGYGITSHAIFTHYYTSAPGSITVTATLASGEMTQGGIGAVDIQPIVRTGCASSQSGAATASAHGSGTNAGEIAITTTTTGSWVLFQASGYAVSGTALANSTSIASTSSDGTTDAFATGRAASATGTPGSATFGWSGSSTLVTLTALEILPGGTTHAGTAGLAGIGTLSGAGVFASTATLSGSGTLTGTATVGGTRGTGTATLSGSGTLSASVTGTFLYAETLSGIGTLTGSWVGLLQVPPVTLSGVGTLSLAGLHLSYIAPLSGSGTMYSLATGGLVFGTSISVPYSYPLSSCVFVAPPGSSAWVPLGSIGVITALTYSFTCPGGADQMTATIMVPAAYRTQLFNPGWQVSITRGGHQVWDGKMDEPVPTPAGWTLTASGTGNRGTDYLAIFSSTWPSGEPDQAVNNAIARGMPWINPGIGTPAGAWFGQAVDSGAQTVTDLLNLVCTRGAYTWYVNSQPGGYPGDDLSVFPLPSAVNRLLTCTNPVPRTLGGDINTIYLRYQITADNASSSTGTSTATYGLTSVSNAQSVTTHGTMETYIDLSDVGTMTQAAAQVVGTDVLAIYQRASFAGPFTASYGQLMNTGGAPIDPGTDQAGTVIKLILTDYGYGGEVDLSQPLTFIVGSYTWDDLAQTATLVPYVSVDASLSGLLSLANQVLTPIAIAST